MSFSSKVKKELSTQCGTDRHCDIAELAAIINLCGIIEENKRFIKIQTESIMVAKKCFTLIKKTFNIDIEISIRKNKQLNKNRVYIIFIKNSASVEKILCAMGNNETFIYSKNISPIVVKKFCCKRAYIRGAFLGTGSITNPEKNYHLEFVNTDEKHAYQLIELINSFSITAKLALRKDHFIVYLKDGEKIVDLLNIMGAYISLMDLENVRILKDMRNNVNRIVNCETANLNKTVGAAVKQLEDITFIRDKKGLSFLSPQLEEIAYIRLQNPDISLKEIGQMLSPMVSKSGVNHRLRKIRDIAELLRSDIL